MQKIDFESDVPLTRQFREILLERFVGDKKSGDRLPPERDLAGEYGVHRMVVQRTIQGLCKEGYFYRRPRHGTFVSRKTSVLRIAFYELPAYSFSEIIKRFEKKHPDITIEKTEVDPKASPIIFEQLLESNQVDVVKLSESLFQNFAAPDMFKPLDAVKKEEQKGTFSKPWQAFRWKNSFYAVPLAFSPMVIIYNKELFKETGISPPLDWNWSEFLEIARKLTSGRNSSSCRYAFMCPFSRNQWPVFALQNNGTLDPNLDDFNLSSSSVREAVNFLHDLLHRWKVAPVMRESEGGAIELFSRGKVAMIMMTYYGFPILRQTVDFDWDILPLPRNRRRATSLLADGVAIARNTTSLKSCREFIRFLMTPEIQDYLAKQRSLIPLKEASAENVKSKVPVNYQLFREELSHSKCLALPYHIPAVQKLQEEMDFYWYGIQDYEETVKHIKNRGDDGKSV